MTDVQNWRERLPASPVYDKDRTQIDKARRVTSVAESKRILGHARTLVEAEAVAGGAVQWRGQRKVWVKVA